MLKLYPTNKAANNLALRTMSLAQFLVRQNVKLTKTLKAGLLHTHCHDKSLGMDGADKAMLHTCFEILTEPEPGCCGMAGSFGLRKKTHEIGQTLFQRNLKPAINNCDADTLIVSNGYSCRSQLDNNTDKQVYHSVEILEKCL